MFVAALLFSAYVGYYTIDICRNLLRLARIKREYREWRDDVRNRQHSVH